MNSDIFNPSEMHWSEAAMLFVKESNSVTALDWHHYHRVTILTLRKISALWVCVLHFQSEAELVWYHHDDYESAECASAHLKLFLVLLYEVAPLAAALARRRLGLDWRGGVAQRRRHRAGLALAQGVVQCRHHVCGERRF